MTNSIVKNLLNKETKGIFSFKSVKNKETGIITATITTSFLDLDNQVLLSTGMDPTPFMASKTILFDHKKDFPIGKLIGKPKQGRKRWTMEWKMIENNTDKTFPSDYIQLCLDQGIINAMSVGLIATDGRLANKKDIEMFGKDVEIVITEWKLIEVSLVTVPANSDALITSTSKALKDKQITREMIQKHFPNIIDKIEEEEIVEEKEIKCINIELIPEKKNIKRCIDIVLYPKEIDKKAKIKESVKRELARRNGELYY